jgi:hypothetical protein
MFNGVECACYIGAVSMNKEGELTLESWSNATRSQPHTACDPESYRPPPPRPVFAQFPRRSSTTRVAITTPNGTQCGCNVAGEDVKCHN